LSNRGNCRVDFGFGTRLQDKELYSKFAAGSLDLHELRIRPSWTVRVDEISNLGSAGHKLVNQFDALGIEQIGE